jgi:RimJ/RimL family protein N-acetyltransferase
MPEAVDLSAVSVQEATLRDPMLHAEFVGFMTSQTFPHHVRTRWTGEQVEQWLRSGALDNGTLLRATLDDHVVGYVHLQDVSGEAVTLDLRIADAWRSHGIGTRTLALSSDLVFTQLSASRLEGVTRIDNIAMRRAFRSCGFVLECCYRDGWPTTSGPAAALGYARLRKDWRTGSVTTVPWDDVLAQESGRMST